MSHRPLASLFFLAALLGLAACSTPPLRERFTSALQDGDVVEGEMHGVYPPLYQYVFTYRTPGDFFDFVEVSLVAPTPELTATLAGLHRHDRVRIQGELMGNPSQQMHVRLRSIELVKPFEPVPALPAYEYEASIPSDLEGHDSALFLVHAVDAGGAILVVEYGDIVLPVFVSRPELTKNLARNDVVRLAYEIRTLPDRPVHLQLKDVEQPIEVVDSIMALHGQPASVEGELVLFPRSPQVKFNVFAVLQPLPGQLRRQFTLANFESDEAFKAIREKLQAAWDAEGEGAAVSGRNKLISTKLRVRATGTFNEVDPGQANAQILLAGPDSVEIVAQ
jgi:hypothetical protein